MIPLCVHDGVGDAKNILIVGGGLAGSFLAAESALAGHRITLVDLPSDKTASRVAAGLYNVVTGRTANKTWLAEELLAALDAFFARPSFAHLRPHLHRQIIYRPFSDGATYNDWMAALALPEFAGLARLHDQPIAPDVLDNPIGGLEILNCGWMDVQAVCLGILATLTAEFDFKHLSFPLSYSAIDPATGEVELPTGTEVFDEIIFAEGVGILQNPYFPAVELWPLKGQVLEVRFDPGLPEDLILKYQMFLIPKGNNFYTVGSTYEREFSDAKPSAEGIKTITDAVREHIALPFEVVGVRASIRPTTYDRKPVLGRHPDYPKLIVFNGLGTKGVLQAPYFAALLRQWLDGKISTLPNDVGLERFLKKFA